MPKEETIELRHVRNIIGETSDLASLNPRVSLVSRIRALITKLFGVPQLIHLQGSLGLNSTLAFAAGEDNIKPIFSDGTYLYAGLQTSPGKIVKVDLATFTKVSTLTLDTGENIVLSFASDGTYLYVGLQTSPGKIVKINLSSFIKESTLTLAAGENTVNTLSSDGTYLYAGLTTTPAKVVKIDLSTFIKDSTLSLASGNNVNFIFTDGIDLYAAIGSTASISKINISTFTETAILAIALQPKVLVSGINSLFSDGLYLYSIAFDSNSCYCTKIDLNTFTEIQYVDVGLTNALFSDGTYLYIGSNTTNGITKLDLITFKILSSIPVPEGSISSLFSDGTYIYAGLNVAPGILSRKYILPMSDLHQRRIDVTKECTQSAVSATTSDGLANGTTLIDTTRTEAIDFWNDMILLILGGVYKGQARRISDFDFATNTLTVSPGFGGKIVSGVRYAILPQTSTGISQADITTIKNNSIATVSDGTYTHASNTNEQNAFVIATATQDIIIYLDMVAVTQATTIREYVEVDGINPRQISAKIYPADFDTAAKAVIISFKQPNKDYKVTLQSSVAEGASIDIPWTQRLESRS